MAEPYNNPLQAKKVLIGGLQETTSGTLPTIEAAQVLPMIFTDYSCEPGDLLEGGERESNLGMIGKVAGERKGTLSFTMEVDYAGPFVSMLTACGFVSGHPTRDWANRKTWGFRTWEDGISKALAGCSGNCVLDFTAGKRAFAKFTFTGVWQGVTDVAMPAKPTYTALPWTSSGSTLTIGAAAIPASDKLTVDLGVTVAPRKGITATGGIVSFYAAEIKPKITLGCEARTVASRDAYGLLLAGTQAAFSYQVTDGTHTLTVTAPKLQRASVTTGERENIKTHAEVFDCCISADGGEDEVTIAAA